MKLRVGDVDWRELVVVRLVGPCGRLVPWPEKKMEASRDKVTPHERQERWYVSKEQLEKESPSRRDGMDALRELNYRQQAASLIQDMGERMKL